jgi:hypothetical protein
MVRAPFTSQEVESLNRWQNATWVHPYTCGSGRRKDATHVDGEGKLVATETGWSCPYCEYTQDWAHGFMMQGPTPKPA